MTDLEFKEQSSALQSELVDALSRRLVGTQQGGRTDPLTVDEVVAKQAQLIVRKRIADLRDTIRAKTNAEFAAIVGANYDMMTNPEWKVIVDCEFRLRFHLP